MNEKFENLSDDYDMSPVQKVMLEALGRLIDIGDPNRLVDHVLQMSSKEIQDYLSSNESSLIPEEKFYLQTLVPFRKQIGK